MVCFDTDFLIAYIRNDSAAIGKLEDLQARGIVDMYTTSINAVELFKGAFRAKNREQEVNKAKKVLGMFELLPLDMEPSELAGKLDNELKSNPIEDYDLLIASIVVSNGQRLITRNKKHFEKVSALNIESW